MRGEGWQGRLMPQIAPQPPHGTSAHFQLSKLVTFAFNHMPVRVFDASGVFANSEMPARYVKCYGFDYDYTLATYSPAVLATIYTLACTHLVQHLGYPEQLVTKCAYDPTFAIRGTHGRGSSDIVLLLLLLLLFNSPNPVFHKLHTRQPAGLHFDSQKGFLLKIDQFFKVQPGYLVDLRLCTHFSSVCVHTTRAWFEWCDYAQVGLSRAGTVKHRGCVAALRGSARFRLVFKGTHAHDDGFVLLARGACVADVVALHLCRISGANIVFLARIIGWFD
jgi:hypothetical protein